MYTDFYRNRRSLLYKNRSWLLCIHSPQTAHKRGNLERKSIKTCNKEGPLTGRLFNGMISDLDATWAMYSSNIQSEQASSSISNLVCWCTKCLQIYTHKFTINGCSILVRIFFSFCTCSTCLSLITSLIFIIFKAWYSPDLWSRQSSTRPKVPVPEVCKRTLSLLEYLHNAQHKRPH